MNASRSLHLKVGLLALLLLFLGAVSGGAATYNLTAEATNLTLPGPVSIPVWGYRLTSGAAGSATVPGPEIRVPAGDTTLIINLSNDLPEATSLQIIGQTLTAPGLPTYADGRVMSFVKETASGNPTPMEYRWDNLKPGTYMLQSATNPAKQVQMGLFAPVIHDFASGMAYDGVAYDTDRVLVFHEIDPEIHAAIQGGTYGLGGTITSSVFRHPIYFLINGAVYPETSLAEVTPGQTVLLRFIGGGLETHTPMILNKYMTVEAQDGIPKNYSQETYGFELNASGTVDALVSIGGDEAQSVFPIHDGRNRYLTNAGDLSEGGMIVELPVGDAIPPDVVTVLRARWNNPNDQLRVWATSDDPTAVLTVDGYSALDVTSKDFTDPNVLNGRYTRLYVANISTNPGSATANSSAGGSATSAVPATVAPEAFGDAYAGDQDAALSVPAAGVLANDSKGGYLIFTESLRAVIDTPPSNGGVGLNADGSFTYTPDPGFTGPDSFTYVAEAYSTTTNATLATTAPATVNLSVNTLRITRTLFRNNETRVSIVAESDAPVGTITLRAYANYTDGGPAENLGKLNYKADKGDYRALRVFEAARGLPVSITVTSSQGGSVTESIPFSLP